MTIHPIIAGLVPSVVVALIFWWVMRAVVRADRNERLALARAEAEAAAKEADKSQNNNSEPK